MKTVSFHGIMMCMEREQLYIGIPQDLKESLRALAESEQKPLSKYVIDVLTNHVKMMRIMKQGQFSPVLNPSFIEAVQFANRFSP